MNIFLNERIGIFGYLAQNGPTKWVGRTALMKLCYFLQTLRGVPLRYNFSLYSYGPFDSAVLSDLGEAEALGVVREEVAFYPAGYGYRISSLLDPRQIDALGGKLLQTHRGDLDWVLNEFGGLSAADLELTSTIIYTDREAYRSGEKTSVTELARRVREVKPHFTMDHVVQMAESLLERSLLIVTGRY